MADLEHGNYYVIRGQEYITYVALIQNSELRLIEVTGYDEATRTEFLGGEQLAISGDKLQLCDAFGNLRTTSWEVADILPSSIISEEENALSAYFDVVAAELLQDVDLGAFGRRMTQEDIDGFTF